MSKATVLRPAVPVFAAALVSGMAVCAADEAATAALQQRENWRCLVVIEGDAGNGSGFIGACSNGPALFTNIHVIDGNKVLQARMLTGQALPLTGLRIADRYDVAAFAVAHGIPSMEIIPSVEGSVALGDEVVVLGNSLGAGVVTEIRGKVTGIGPELIEVNAAFVSGNSGSPVVHVKTGKVVGIATFTILRTLEGFGRDSRFNQVERRFAYRLDNVPAWRSTTWAAFASEAEFIERVSRDTTDIWNFAADIARNGQVTQWEAHLRKGNIVRGNVEAWQRSLAKARGGQGRTSLAQVDADKKRLLLGVTMLLQSNRAGVNVRAFTKYHRQKYEEEMAYREQLKRYFDGLKDVLTNDPRFLSM